MRIHVRSGAPVDRRDEAQVIMALEGPAQPERLLSASSTLSRAIEPRLRGSGFRGTLNEAFLMPSQPGRWALLVGLGKGKDLSLERVRQAAATAARTARSRGFAAVSLPVIDERTLGSIDAIAQATAEGALLGLYRYTRFKRPPKDSPSLRLEMVGFAVKEARDLPLVKRAVARAQALADAVTLARDLINGPSNLVTPTHLVEQARSLAKTFKLTCTVLPFAELKRRGFGGIVGVAQGSAHPAQLIVIEYAPRAAKATIALCGKGITFDSGGISLKPAENMEKMKYDMSGAAAVLGTLKAAAMLKLPVRLVGIIAATENLPSGTAQKPGDVLTTLSGRTVEVINTDAEGRLVLADCLHYAKRHKPDCVVDLATLTGACVIALGGEAIGLFANRPGLIEQLRGAGEATRERVWPMPLWGEYGRLIKSDIADAKNTGGREAGAITAAKFLEAFAGEQAWAHLDIAGTAWTDRDKPYVPKGAVGIGVRLLIHFLEHWQPLKSAK